MTIHTGDCIEVMAAMEPDSVDAVVTDPPYGLEFMGKGWDKPWAAHFTSIGDGPPLPDRQLHVNPRCRKCGGYERGTKHKCSCELPDWTDTQGAAVGRNNRGFMEWCEAWGREALRVTKPGGYLLAFGGTRTHHRLVCGLEDAGWIIRDELTWIYASGFPKGKANLKPAHEPIVLARKPGSLRPLAIDACRIQTTEIGTPREPSRREDRENWRIEGGSNGSGATDPSGRWPSNLLLSDSELFDQPNPYVVGSGAVTNVVQPYVPDTSNVEDWEASSYWMGANKLVGYGDSGGYSRFFIVPKADRGDREPVLRGQLAEQDSMKWAGGSEKMAGLAGKYPDGSPRPPQYRENAHPTVKPTDLMRHLVRLVTPQGGTVLDCFLGSGSTAIAAELEGFAWVGIEKEPEYVAIAEARLNGTQRGLGLDVPAPQANRSARPRETEGRDLSSNRQDQLIWKSYQPDGPSTLLEGAGMIEGDGSGIALPPEDDAA